MNKQTVTYEDVTAGLRELVLPENPVILTHISLKSFGYVEGGALTVIRALQSICGAGGTLVMPTLTFGLIDERDPLFDVLQTPSNTGHITEMFRKLPDVKRSQHVLSSCAAHGRHADFITSYHGDTPCGPGSPYHKIAELDGYSLFIGADFAANSLFHVAEEVVHPDYLDYRTIDDAKIINSDGSVDVCPFRRYNCSERGIIRRLERMEPLYLEAQVIREVRIGMASVKLLRAADNLRISCELLRRNPNYILK